MADPAFSKMLRADNWVGFRDLSIRVLVEVFLIFSVYHLFEQGNELLGFSVFYFLAIWHGFWGYAGIGHELSHRTVFSYRRLNDVLYYVASFLVWSNPVFFRDSHHHHHQSTFSDDDVEVTELQKLEWRRGVAFLTLDIAFMLRRIRYTFVNSLGYKNTQGRLEKIPSAHRFAAVMTLLFQLTVNLLIYYLVEDFFYNILWIILPFTGQILNRRLAHAQHSNLKKYRELGPLKHSRSIRLPGIISFLYAGMNYHSEHHLIPSVPYYHLPALSNYLTKFYGHQVEDWRSFCRV